MAPNITCSDERLIYRLRHLPADLRELQRWDKLCDVLLDFDFLQAKVGAPRGRLGTQPPPATVFDVLQDLHEALGALPADHTLREQVAAVWRALQSNSNALREDPSIMVQQIFNAAQWEWDEQSLLLGQRVRASATVHYERTHWLMRCNQPPFVPDPALLRIIGGHTDSVSAVAVTADGRTVVSGSYDRTVRVWDAATGEERRRLEGHTDSVTAVAVAADGWTVVSASEDRTVRMWDTATGAERGRFLHTSPVYAVAVTLDGRTVVSGSTGGTVRVWDAATGAERRSLKPEVVRALDRVWRAIQAVKPSWIEYEPGTLDPFCGCAPEPR